MNLHCLHYSNKQTILFRSTERSLKADKNNIWFKSKLDNLEFSIVKRGSITVAMFDLASDSIED